MQQYDFDRFLARVSDLPPTDAIEAAESEASRVDASTRNTPGAVQARQNGAYKYLDQLKAFLFYMRFGERPLGATEVDFRKYSDWR